MEKYVIIWEWRLTCDNLDSKQSHTSIEPEKERLLGWFRLSFKEPVEKGPSMVFIDSDVTWKVWDWGAWRLARKINYSIKPILSMTTWKTNLRLSTYRTTTGVNTNLVAAYVDLHRQWQGCGGLKDQGMRRLRRSGRPKQEHVER